MSWYEPYKKYGDLVICLFVYCAYIWHIFTNASSIIGGYGVTNRALQGKAIEDSIVEISQKNNII